MEVFFGTLGWRSSDRRGVAPQGEVGKVRKAMLLFAGVLLTVVLVAPSASATPPSPATAIFVPGTMTLMSGRAADGNTFLTYARTGAITGTYAGPTSDTLRLVLYAGGSAVIHITGSCECTLGDRSGTFVYVVEGSGIFPTSVHGHFVGGHGTGGLSGLHVVGALTGDFSTVYLGGQFHFD
jgi:hypothetical protein